MPGVVPGIFYYSTIFFITLFYRLFSSYLFVDLNGTHQYHGEQHKTDNAPQPAHAGFHGHDHHDGNKKNSGYFIPYSQLIGAVFKNAFHFIGINFLQRKMISIQTCYKAQLHPKPRRNTAQQEGDPSAKYQG